MAPFSRLFAVPLSWVGLRSSVAQRWKNTSPADLWTIRSTQKGCDAQLGVTFETERSPSPTLGAFSLPAAQAPALEAERSRPYAMSILADDNRFDRSRPGPSDRRDMACLQRLCSTPDPGAPI